MSKFLLIFSFFLVISACKKVEVNLEEQEGISSLDVSERDGFNSLESLTGKIDIGEELPNPFVKDNVQLAWEIIYPTELFDLPVTDLYVRFLPSDWTQYRTLYGLDIVLFDYSMTAEVTSDGDYF